MPRIALLSPTFSGFSGIDRVVENQARRLAQKGDVVEIFSFEADMTPPADVKLSILGMPKSLFWQRIYRLLLPLYAIRNSRFVARLKDFDIVYSHQYPMNWLASMAQKQYGIKYVYYDYGLTPPAAFATSTERIYMHFFNWMAMRTARNADSAISISHYLHNELKKDTGLISEIIYPRIDTDRFYPGIDGSGIRQKWGLDDEPLILYIGRISPHKGIHLLIQAFLEVQKEIPEAKLIIAGKHTFAGYSRRLRSISNDSIIFAGYVPDAEIPAYYAACDIYVTATLWEGFNLPLAEAEACGRPVIAYNLGPHPEVVSDGRTGLLTLTGNIPDMASAIRSLLVDTDKRHSMGQNAAVFAREKFG